MKEGKNITTFHVPLNYPKDPSLPLQAWRHDDDDDDDDDDHDHSGYYIDYDKEDDGNDDDSSLTGMNMMKKGLGGVKMWMLLQYSGEGVNSNVHFFSLYQQESSMDLGN